MHNFPCETGLTLPDDLEGQQLDKQMSIDHIFWPSCLYLGSNFNSIIVYYQFLLTSNLLVKSGFNKGPKLFYMIRSIYEIYFCEGCDFENKMELKEFGTYIYLKIKSSLIINLYCVFSYFGL